MTAMAPISSKLQDFQVVTDIGALHDLKMKAKENPGEALRPVAEQFEAIFIQQVLQESRKVKLDEGWLDGDDTDFYKDWHDKQLSQSISAKGSMGMADQIVKQLAPNAVPLSQEELEAYIKTQDAKRESAGIVSIKPAVNLVVEPAMSTQDMLTLRGL